jgi:hypothetical protein
MLHSFSQKSPLASLNVLLLTISSLALISSVNAQINYILHHRLITPSHSPTSLPPLKPYGTIKITNSTAPSTDDTPIHLTYGYVVEPGLVGTFREVSRSERTLFDATDGVGEGGEGENGVGDGGGGWWYQVGLEDPESHEGEEAWVLASTKGVSTLGLHGNLKGGC